VKIKSITFCLVATFFFLVSTTINGYATHLSSSEKIPATIIASQSTSSYLIKTKMKSYFALDLDGQLIPEVRDGKRYFKKDEKEYTFDRTLFINKSALIVIDPWLDSGDEDLNAYYKPLLSNKVIPLVSKAILLGFPVYVLTNDPKKNYADYGSEIPRELVSLANQEKIKVLYHQDFDEKSFADFLHARSIDMLIYSGFASNMCIIGRSMGMIPMKSKGFRLFFIPEASAAVEFSNTWKTSEIHQATTLLISQWVAELIEFKHFMQIVLTKH